jgi:hypothetical protein
MFKRAFRFPDSAGRFGLSFEQAGTNRVPAQLPLKEFALGIRHWNPASQEGFG